ncbi:hypothetical protein [Pseudonocardia asaccharolytica]|uniref:hypothetical protein n=1 Tax=Pseudonocardia asaccharolytica TaxID=54010 RepID=UPI001B7F88F2
MLDVFRFLADVIRTDLEPALMFRGGYDEFVFRGGEKTPTFMKIAVKASWTTHSHAGLPMSTSCGLRIGLDGISRARKRSPSSGRRGAAVGSRSPARRRS